jgi:formylglycine-generating enzyme required for sulfatase activity
LSKPGKVYRLPSEAEFEYVLRAGGDSPWPWGDDVSAACTHGNVADRQAKEKFPHRPALDCNDDALLTYPVGGYRRNGYGVYDLTGNAWEWVEDCWNGDYQDPPGYGRAWMAGSCDFAVLRGGSWTSFGRYLRSAVRFRDARLKRSNDTGFRPARSVTP